MDISALKTERDELSAKLSDPEFLSSSQAEAKKAGARLQKLQKLIAGKMNVDSYQVFIGKEGDILLRPAVSIPSNEAWAYRNPEVIGRIRRGLKDAAEGKVEKVDDLESFLRDL